jgi:poly(hydroxyalkanoate) depolymerase family esterase
MARLSDALAKLSTLRQHLQALLQGKVPTPARTVRQPRTDGLQEVDGFGSNPGNVRMFAYVPERLSRSPALVVALHGCTQSALIYDRGSGWSTLAEVYGFVVVYPEQQRSNNPQGCFSWFLPGDTAREGGEALSIRQMVDDAIRKWGIDRRRVFVTGLSAGGAMASTMLATYPDIFSGGAIIAGLPYGCATTVEEAFAAMLGKRTRPQHALGDRVLMASPHRGPWPRISVWHGSADPVVRPSNAGDVIQQWAEVHQLPLMPTREEFVCGHLRRVWNGAHGAPLIEAYTISGMGHGVPLATGDGDERCGTIGPFFLEAGLSSTHQIAKFWGLTAVSQDARSRASTTLLQKPQISTPSSVASARFRGRTADPPGQTPLWNASPPTPIDPNVAIAAAFKAAGLPVFNASGHKVRPTLPVAPGPIIEAALKAAGLRKP